MQRCTMHWCVEKCMLLVYRFMCLYFWFSTCASFFCMFQRNDEKDERRSVWLDFDQRNVRVSTVILNDKAKFLLVMLNIILLYMIAKFALNYNFFRQIFFLFQPLHNKAYIQPSTTNITQFYLFFFGRKSLTVLAICYTNATPSLNDTNATPSLNENHLKHKSY